MKTPATAVRCDGRSIEAGDSGRSLRRSSGASRRGRRGGARRHLGDLGTGGRARAVRKAAFERGIHPSLDVDRGQTHDLGGLRDDQELRAIEHPLLAEREALRLRQEREVLEDVRNVVDRAAAHLVGVVLEASLPVLMVVDLPITQEAEEALDFFVGNRPTQADAIDVAQRDEHDRFIRDDAQMIETASRAENCFFFDSLDDPETMIRVNDLVADFKRHGSPCVEALYGRPKASRQSCKYSVLLPYWATRKD